MRCWPREAAIEGCGDFWRGDDGVRWSATVFYGGLRADCRIGGRLTHAAKAIRIARGQIRRGPRNQLSQEATHAESLMGYRSSGVMIGCLSEWGSCFAECPT